MAVIQLSRIQVRRGQANQGTGLPQLAGGEFGWAIDTQELYIGNGSLTEGAPRIGNTKVLTQHDNIFALADAYSYKAEAGYIQTGSSASSPTNRSLQDRLDDQVSIKHFGLTGDPAIAVGDDFQRAIDQLFINDASKGEPSSRVVLFVDAGIYNIDRTIYLPPFVHLVGAGVESTIIRYTGTGTVFQTVNETSTPGNPALDEVATDSATTFNNQPRFIHMSNMTIEQTDVNGIGLHLSSCVNSLFENIKFIGVWAIGNALPIINQGELPPSTGILLDSLSTVVRSNNNKFENCVVSNFAYGVGGNQKITHNHFDSCEFFELGKGVYFGAQMNGTEEIPMHNLIHNSNFHDIHSEGIDITRGQYNQSQNNTFTLCGNAGSSEYYSLYPVINSDMTGNESVDDYFSRTVALNAEFVTPSTYVAEVKGNLNQVMGYTQAITIPPSSQPTNIVRFPAEQNQSYEIEYYMYNYSYDLQRTGKLVISCDKTGLDKVYISDAYDQIGDESYESEDTYLLYDIEFSAEFVNDGTSIEPVYSIYLKASNTFAAPTYFRYKLVNHKIKF